MSREIVHIYGRVAHHACCIVGHLSLEYEAFVSNPVQPPVEARTVFNRKGESSLFD